VEKLLWKVLYDSKGGKVYLPAREQYNNLSNILAGIDKETVRGLHGVWRQKLKEFRVPEFDLLHASRGGVVDGGDDAFYADFANWLLAQGEDMFNNFKKNGHKLVLVYIRGNDIPQEDLTFENMGYAFSRDLEKKSAPKNPAEFTLGELRNIILAADTKFQVANLVLAGQKDIVGYRVGYNISRVVNGKKSFWQFDIPNDGKVNSDHQKLFNVVMMAVLELRPRGELLLTREEFDTGVYAISLEGNQQAIDLIIAGIEGKLS
jgi:hypothetical protein